MTNIYVERLRTLYSIMAGIPSKVVNMRHWRNDKTGGDPSDKELLAGAQGGHACGTTACAMGWAAAYPEFKKAGLRFSARDNTVKFGGVVGFDAAASFFDIGSWDAETLFEPNYGYTGDKQVFLKRLRDFMVSEGIITQQRSDELAREEAERDLAEGKAS